MFCDLEMMCRKEVMQDVRQHRGWVGKVAKCEAGVFVQQQPGLTTAGTSTETGSINNRELKGNVFTQKYINKT